MSISIYERISRKARAGLGLLLFAAANGAADAGVAILAGVGAPSGATYGGQELANGQVALRFRSDATDAAAALYVTVDGGTSNEAIPAGGAALMVEDIGQPAAKQAANIHALFAGNDGSNNFPGPFADPDVPRNLRVTFQAGWDGGDVEVFGTFRGQPQSEVFTANPGAIVTGIKPFDTVTSATKGAVGTNPAAASIGDGDSLGLSYEPASNIGTLTAGAVNEAATWDALNGTVKPGTTIPDGSAFFTAAYPRA